MSWRAAAEAILADPDHKRRARRLNVAAETPGPVGSPTLAHALLDSLAGERWHAFLAAIAASSPDGPA